LIETGRVMDATLFNPRYVSANIEKLRLLIKRQMRGHSCQGLKILSISKKSNRSKQKTVSFAIVLIDLARNLILIE
jgi:hypothetical protein